MFLLTHSVTKVILIAGDWLQVCLEPVQAVFRSVYGRATEKDLHSHPRMDNLKFPIRPTYNVVGLWEEGGVSGFFSVSLKSFTDSIVTLSRLSRIVTATSSHWLTDAGEFVSLLRRDSRDVVPSKRDYISSSEF